MYPALSSQRALTQGILCWFIHGNLYFLQFNSVYHPLKDHFPDFNYLDDPGLFLVNVFTSLLIAALLNAPVVEDSSRAATAA